VTEGQATLQRSGTRSTPDHALGARNRSGRAGSFDRIMPVDDAMDDAMDDAVNKCPDYCRTDATPYSPVMRR
jgi:hypothetical protein